MSSKTLRIKSLTNITTYRGELRSISYKYQLTTFALPHILKKVVKQITRTKRRYFRRTRANH